MDELQWILCMILGLRQEQRAAVLGDDTCVIELADMVDHWQPACHATLG